MPTSVRLRAGKKGAMGGTGGQARVPVWTTVLDVEFSGAELPAVYDLNPYVTGAFYDWSLTGAPAEITVSGQGVMTVAAGLAPGIYPLTATVFGPDGSATSVSFDVTIT